MNSQRWFHWLQSTTGLRVCSDVTCDVSKVARCTINSSCSSQRPTTAQHMAQPRSSVLNVLWRFAAIIHTLLDRLSTDVAYLVLQVTRHSQHHVPVWIWPRNYMYMNVRAHTHTHTHSGYQIAKHQLHCHTVRSAQASPTDDSFVEQMNNKQWTVDNTVKYMKTGTSQWISLSWNSRPCYHLDLWPQKLDCCLDQDQQVQCNC